MKVNLGCGKDVRDGYVNVDIDTRILNITHMDMRKFPEEYKKSNGQPLTEVLLLNAIHQITAEETANLITALVPLLAQDGKIVITDIDYDMVANKIAYNRCDIFMLNTDFFYRPGQKSIYNKTNVVAHAESSGLFCLESYYSDCLFGVVLGRV